MLKWILALSACVVFAVAGLVLAHSSTPGLSGLSATASPPSASSGSPDRQFRIFVVGNRMGAVRPCDCKDWQGGGMERELTYFNLKGRDGIPALKLDSGFFTNPAPTYRERLSTLFALMGLESLGYDAMNLSSLDLNVGVATLRRAAEIYHLPLISSNVCDPRTSETLFPPSREITVRNADGSEIARVGILGISNVVSPAYPQGSLIRFGLPGIPSPPPPSAIGGVLRREFIVRPPLEVLSEEVPKLRRRCSIVVVLSWLSLPAARELAQRIEGIDIFVAGDYPEAPPPIEQVGDTILLVPGKEGVYINEVHIRLDEKTGKTITPGEPVELDQKMQKHPGVTPFHQAHMTSFRECSREYTGTDHPNNHAGAITCRGCHLAQYTHWKSTPHAAAFRSLESAGQANNPLCLSCHNTGLMQPGGFRSAAQTPEMTGVQCEACHGPARDHMAWAYRVWRDDFHETSPDARNYNPKRLPRAGRALDTASCVKCHNVQNSPGFDFHRSKSSVCVGHLTIRPLR